MTDRRNIEWKKLNYSGFSELAADASLSKYEKIGFPDSYRAGFEAAIFEDIRAKLPRLAERNLNVLDIGPGCSDLPLMLIDLCKAQGHSLYLVDSEPMLQHLPDADFIVKRRGQLPKDRNEVADLLGKIDVIVCYSVFHYVYVDANPFEFLDLALELLAPSGELLIGDIPNFSKRRRFFASDAGVKFHRDFTKTDTLPTVDFNSTARGEIDDSVVLSVLARVRAAGADAYVLPQTPALKMSNRREDILVKKP